MGLVLFFFRYARFTENELYKEYSFFLIEKIQNSIHQETPINYKHGLSGSGVAVEYLIQHGYIETDTDRACNPMDNFQEWIDKIKYLLYIVRLKL